MYSGSYTAVVIAAGLSSRMHEFKPLLNIGGKPALLRLLDSINETGIDNIVIVTGYKHDVIEDTIKRTNINRLLPIYNENYMLGMFSSVQAGISAVPDCDAALLFPADVPLVSSATITGLIHTWEEGEGLPIDNIDAPFAVPIFEHQNGHPLLIPSVYFSEITTYTGEGGLKAIRNRYAADMIRYDSGDEGCILDVDTPEDYNTLLKYYEQKRK